MCIYSLLFANMCVYLCMSSISYVLLLSRYIYIYLYSQSAGLINKMLKLAEA